MGKNVSYNTHNYIANKFNVARQTVTKINIGYGWKNVA
jgi:hypothetical protein